MAKNSAAPLLILGGAALLLMGGKKKKGSSSKSSGSIYNTNMPPGMDAPSYPGAGTTPPPTTGGAEAESEKWKSRQKGLMTLGYNEVGPATGKPNAATSTAIRLFQSDWNDLMAYLGSIGSPAVGKAPYTDATEDGAWGPATQARYDKAMHEFGDPPVQAEDLQMSFNSFRDLISELRSRT